MATKKTTRRPGVAGMLAKLREIADSSDNRRIDIKGLGIWLNDSYDHAGEDLEATAVGYDDNDFGVFVGQDNFFRADELEAHEVQTLYDAVLNGRRQQPSDPKTFRSHNVTEMVGEVVEAFHTQICGIDVCEATLKTVVRFQRLNGELRTQTSKNRVHLWQCHLDIPVWKIRAGNILSVRGEYKNTVVYRHDGAVRLVGVFAAKAEVLAEDGVLELEDADIEYGKPGHID